MACGPTTKRPDRLPGACGYDVRFEVINAGREGINSNDIAAVVRYELLPLAGRSVRYWSRSCCLCSFSSYEGQGQHTMPSICPVQRTPCRSHIRSGSRMSNVP